MLDVIDALQILGADADRARAAPADIDAVLRREQIEPALRAALLAGDADALNALLRAPSVVCCLINPAEEEEEEEEEDEEEEDEEGEGADDEDESNRTRKRL